MARPILAKNLPIHNYDSSDEMSQRILYVNEWRQKSLVFDNANSLTSDDSSTKSTGSKLRRISFADESGKSPRTVGILRNSTCTSKNEMSKHKQSNSTWAYLKSLVNRRNCNV